MARRRSSDAGFTLVELLVVVLVIGVLAAVAVPSYLGARSRAADGAARALVRNAYSVAAAARNGGWDSVSLAQLQANEPSTVFVDATTAVTDSRTVSMGSTAAQLSLAARSSNGACQRLRVDANGGTTWDQPATCRAAGVAGLAATAFSDQSFTTQVATYALSSSVGESWGFGGPSVGVADNFTVRYSGSLTVPSSGTWTFTSSVDDWLRVVVNGTQVISGNSSSGQVNMAAGTYPLTLEFTEGGGGANWALNWTPPGGSSTAVPLSALSVDPSGVTSASPGAPTLVQASGGVSASAVGFTVTPTPGVPVTPWSSTVVATCSAAGQPTRTSTVTGWSVAVDGLTTGVAYSCSATLNGSPASNTVTVTPQATFSGSGLTAVSYATQSFTNPVTVTQLTGSTGVNWGAAGPSVGVGDMFTVRYSGSITVPSSGTWTFTSNVDDWLRVVVNGTQVISGNSSSGTITLSAGTYPVTVEFTEGGGAASWALNWTPPGGSSTAVPITALTP